MERDAARTATDRPASLVLGAVPSATASLVPQAISRLRESGGPDVTVISRITPQLGPMVVSRELDAAVVTDAPPGLPRDPELRAVHLGDDESVVVAAADHPLAGKDRVDVRLLASETWIEDNVGSEIMVRQLAARAGFEPRISFTADDLIGKTGMAAAGLGVALVPDLLVPALRPDLAVLRLKRPVRRGIYLSRAQGTRRSRPARRRAAAPRPTSTCSPRQGDRLLEARELGGVADRVEPGDHAVLDQDRRAACRSRRR